MKIYKLIVFIIPFIIICSCTGNPTTRIIENIVVCSGYEINVSALDNIVIPNNSNPILWEGKYNKTSVTISFTQNVDNDGETETYNFVFDKIGNCLKLNRGYEYYQGSHAGISALTKLEVLEFYIKDWEIDKKITGQIIYRDHHNKQIYKRKYWIELTENDFEEEETNYTYFPECFSNKLPTDIDLNSDGIVDYKIIAEENRDEGNIPAFTSYAIKLISTNETINEILSPKNAKIPYPVLFEPPFSSQNTKNHNVNNLNAKDIKSALDIFYEFDTPYESYNFFLNNSLTYKNSFTNNLEDYYLVKLIRNNQSFYGWIKIDFNALNCQIDVLDTFLNSNANEHVAIN